MKILNREQFLSLPSGILYMKYEPYNLGELQIKESTLDNDFICLDLNGIEMSDEEQLFHVLIEAQENGRNVELDMELTYRDALYDKNQLFMVLEKDDVLKLTNKLNDILSNYPNEI